MKKVLFIFSVLAILFASCSHQVEHKSKDIKITVQMDTSIIYQEPITAPRYSCDGKLLSQPKLIGMKDVVVPLVLKKDTVISGDSTRQKAGSASTATSHKTSSGLDWLWPVMEFFLGLLLFFLGLFLVALAIWGLIKLAKMIFQKNSKPAAKPSAPATPGAAPTADPALTEPVPPVPPVPPAGSGSIYYIGNVENLHIHSNESVVEPLPKKKPDPRRKGKK
ncbi:MAG TPA: hypothetical protein PLO44_01205 [Candidatus Paceibacterota bacterium]|nr:hypothetical protein [Candidatus Paceibacterota bacterium]